MCGNYVNNTCKLEPLLAKFWWWAKLEFCRELFFSRSLMEKSASSGIVFGNNVAIHVQNSRSPSKRTIGRSPTRVDTCSFNTTPVNISKQVEVQHCTHVASHNGLARFCLIKEGINKWAPTHTTLHSDDRTLVSLCNPPTILNIRSTTLANIGKINKIINFSCIKVAWWCSLKSWDSIHCFSTSTGCFSN